MAFFDVPPNTALRIHASTDAAWRQRYKLSQNGQLLGIYDEASTFTLPPSAEGYRIDISGECYHMGPGRHGWRTSAERLVRHDNNIIVFFNDTGADADFNDLIVYFRFISNQKFDKLMIVDQE